MMSGHHPWPPGSLHKDLQRGRKEVFRLGEWSIFSAGSEDGITNAHWSSFIMHCSSWQERRRKPVPLQTTTMYKGRDIRSEYTDEFNMEVVTVRCNENMVAFGITRCPGCRKKIPDEIVGLWKLQNFDQIQEVNSV